MSGLIQVLLGIAVVFFLPGYTLISLLFPRKGELDPDYDIVYRVALGMGLSIVIAIFVGFGLNAISTETEGYVSPGPLWISLLSFTVVFFVAGWYRGAYPWLGLLHEGLYRTPAPRRAPGEKTALIRFGREERRLVLERVQLLEDIETYRERSSTSNPSRKLYYQRRIEQARERLEQVNGLLDDARRGSG
jgi:hypothetical protein